MRFCNYLSYTTNGLNFAIEGEKIPEKVQETGKYFENTLRDLSDLDIVGEVRGSHFMMGIEFVADKETKLAFEEDKNVALRLQQHAQKRGLIARPLGNILILSPTLILSNKDIDAIGSILRESIEAVTKELKNDPKRSSVSSNYQIVIFYFQVVNRNYWQFTFHAFPIFTIIV